MNVGVFQPLKQYHIDVIDKALRQDDEKFGKLEFLIIFQSFCNQTFIIRHTFKFTSLVPFNPNVVNDKIREQAQRQQSALRALSLRLNQRSLQSHTFVVKYKQKL